ncbi:hypothetical protein IKQ21_04600 [bacterium]|nr:hypothetical protein [bacterium]
MSVNKVENINMFTGGCISVIDREEKEILRRLLMYGIVGTGNKTIDKHMLHEIELREAKKEDTASSKFLTVTKSEQENFQQKKKDERVETNPKAYPDTTKGAEILGEQIYLAIQMKKNCEEK